VLLWYEVEVGTFVIALELLIPSICVCTNQPTLAPYSEITNMFSMVLMVIVNASLEFIHGGRQTSEHESDGGVPCYINFWNIFEQNALNIPPLFILLNTGVSTCFFAHHWDEALK
jgi:hypothetical protein